MRVQAWGWWVYTLRSQMISERSGKDFDNVSGPVVVCLALIVALCLNFGLKVRDTLTPLTALTHCTHSSIPRFYMACGNGKCVMINSYSSIKLSFSETKNEKGGINGL